MADNCEEARSRAAHSRVPPPPLACGSQEAGYQPALPAMYHAAHVTTASAATTGTNTDDTRSAKAWMGALLQQADVGERRKGVVRVPGPARPRVRALRTQPCRHASPPLQLFLHLYAAHSPTPLA